MVSFKRSTVNHILTFYHAHNTELFTQTSSKDLLIQYNKDQRQATFLWEPVYSAESVKTLKLRFYQGTLQ